MLYACRVTRPYGDLIPFFDYLDLNSTKSIVYEHEQDEEISRTHIHFLVETDISTDTMKYQIRKVIGSVLKTDWSFKTAQDNKFITYMSKGYLVPKRSTGFTEEEIEEFKTSWVDNKGKKHKDNKPTVWQLAKEISDSIQINQRYTNYEDRFRDALHVSIDVCNRYKQPYEFHYLKRLTTTALGMNPLTKYDVISHIMSKEFSSYKV